MKIRFLCSAKDVVSDTCFRKGKEYYVEDVRAKRFISLGDAEKV